MKNRKGVFGVDYLSNAVLAVALAAVLIVVALAMLEGGTGFLNLSELSDLTGGATKGVIGTQ